MVPPEVPPQPQVVNTRSLRPLGVKAYLGAGPGPQEGVTSAAQQSTAGEGEGESGEASP